MGVGPGPAPSPKVERHWGHLGVVGRDPGCVGGLAHHVDAESRLGNKIPGPDSSFERIDQILPPVRRGIRAGRVSAPTPLVPAPPSRTAQGLSGNRPLERSGDLTSFRELGGRCPTADPRTGAVRLLARYRSGSPGSGTTGRLGPSPSGSGCGPSPASRSGYWPSETRSTTPSTMCSYRSTRTVRRSSAAAPTSRGAGSAPASISRPRRPGWPPIRKSLGRLRGGPRRPASGERSIRPDSRPTWDTRPHRSGSGPPGGCSSNPEVRPGWKREERERVPTDRPPQRATSSTSRALP